MSVSLFNKKDNIKMLWDVVSDEDIFSFLSPDIQSKIYNLFLNNIQGFFDVERTKTNSLVDLNKKYILLILNHIKNTYPYQPSKIKIHSEPLVKELVTFEEIQNDRKSQFEKDFSRIQEDFEDSINVKPPPVPEFADPKEKIDKPIKEIDKILKEMQAQRNYEVEQINRTYNTTTQVDNWLKPQETSLKPEKLEPKPEQPQNYSRFKFLNELDQDLSPTNPKKNVSFSTNNEIKIFQEDDEEDINIFSKLKKINKKEDNVRESTEDRISNLERNMSKLNEKMDRILTLLSNHNEKAY